MTQGVVAIGRSPSKDASFPFMVFGSIMAHLLLMTLMLALPTLIHSGKTEPFGGPTGGGLNVIGVVDFTLGKTGPPAAKPKTQAEPAPSLFLKKTQQEAPPLDSKLTLPDTKKKPKEQPADTKSLNVPQNQRKMEGPFGTGEDKSKNAGKSGANGAGQFGVGSFGAGQAGPGGYGTGTGVAFPFPWYLENVFTKIELNWRKPFITETIPTTYQCVLYFVITSTGQVKNVEVEKTSGIASLDRSAQSAVLGSAPFAPLPSQWTEPDLAFRVTFSYSPQDK